MKTVEKKNKSSLLRKAFSVRYCLLASFCTALIMTVVYYCFKLTPFFGDITILRMDMYHQYGPLYAELYERITNLDSFLYSWKSGGGSGFLGNFYNYLSSPTLIIMLLFGHENMPEAIAAMIYVKALIASFTFAYFLTKKFNNRTPLTSAFGVLYACSGYFIAYYWNVMWLDAFYLFPLVMLGIEKIINHGKLKLYLVSLALTLVTNYYIGYMVCIFSVLYFIYSYFSQYGFTSTLKGSLGRCPREPKIMVKHTIDIIRNSRLVDSGVKFGFASLSAGLVSAFALVPIYFALGNCSATSGTWPEEFRTYFSIFDFLANHLAFLVPTIRSSGEDVLPNVYCGMLTVMLVPLFIFSTRINLKEKVLSVGILGVMFLSFYTNYLNFIWHGFHFPNDLPYRFSYMYSFLLLLFAFKALLNIKEYTSRQIIGVGVATLFFVIMVQEIGSKNVSETGIWICVAFVGIYCLALAILKNDRYPAIAAAVLVLCTSCAEYTVANTSNYSMDQPKENFTGDYADFQSIKSEIDEYEGNDYYRMELTQLRARMDPCWYYYNGISTFSSMAYEKTSNMQSRLGMFSNYINSYTYNRQTPVYNAFFALDYIVDNNMNTTADMNPELYKEIASLNKYTAYENLYQLPIAFRTNEEILQWSYENSNPFEVQSGLFGSATGIHTVYNDMVLDTALSGANGMTVDYTYAADGYYPFSVQDPSIAALTFELKIQESGNAYIYFRTSHSNVSSITVVLPSGRIVSQYVDTKPHILDLGYLEAGDSIRVYAPYTNAVDGYVTLYGVTLDNESFIEGYNKLKADSLNVTKFEETEIEGTINVSEDGILYTSINYDTGWTVYIDGEKVSKKNIHSVGDGALLAVDITKGKHTVTFKYVPEGLTTGIIISVVSVIMLALLWAINRTGFFKFCPVVYPKDGSTEDEADDIYEYEELELPKITDDTSAKEAESADDSEVADTEVDEE